MKYTEINIKTSEEGIEPLSAALLEEGITDTVINDPNDIERLLNKKNDYDWDYIDAEVLELQNEVPSITVYVTEDSDKEAVKRAAERLKKQNEEGVFGIGLDLGTLEITETEGDDSDWKDNWKEYFKPAKVSDTIVVKPTWEEYEPKEGEHVLEIDPGMAFGTGTHETTSLCIKLMEKYMKPGDTLLDVGCGSGILSIAAALLGASDALGVEIDPEAVEIAKENILLNHVENIARAQYGDLTKGIDYKADVVAANLMADLVMMLSESVGNHIKPGGIYISSGILVEKEKLVADAVKAAGFDIIEIREDGMWCAIAAAPAVSDK